MSIKRLPLIILAVTVISGSVFYSSISDVRNRIDWYLLDKADRPLEALAQKCFLDFPAKNATQKIKNLRHCVNIYSTFSADPMNRDKWNNKLGMMQWMAKYSRGETPDAPPMDCYYRSHALVWIFKELGFQAYTLVVTDNANDFMDHVIVRVKNPDTEKWEIQDPLYDTEYKDKSSRSSLDRNDLLTYDLENFEPCDSKGECGWNLFSHEQLKISQIKNYFSSFYDTKEKTLYVSRDFDEKKIRDVRGKKMSFCEKRPEYCDKIVRLGSLN